MDTSPVTMVSLTVSDNGEHGIHAKMSDLMITETVVQNNLWNGISVHGGSLTIGGSAEGRPSVVSYNGGAGIAAVAGRVTFHGRTDVLSNAAGLLALHGGSMDLQMRPDLYVYDNLEIDLLAECHGMVAGYERAWCGSGGCVCLEVDYGVCRPEAASPPGGGFPGLRTLDPVIPPEEKEGEEPPVKRLR
jgi:hypothetical protein